MCVCVMHLWAERPRGPVQSRRSLSILAQVGRTCVPPPQDEQRRGLSWVRILPVRRVWDVMGPRGGESAVGSKPAELWEESITLSSRYVGCMPALSDSSSDAHLQTAKRENGLHCGTQIYGLIRRWIGWSIHLNVCSTPDAELPPTRRMRLRRQVAASTDLYLVGEDRHYIK